MPHQVQRRDFLGATAAALLGASGAAAAPSRAPLAKKKGCCFVTKPGSRWLERTQLLNANWLYSWGADRPDELPDRVEFCPMIWGGMPEKKLAERIESMRPKVASGELRRLMGFNEPDQKSQSNMTVDRVLDLWPILMDLGTPLVSPGCVHPDREWMHEFMEGVEKRNLRVDYVAAHSYGGPSVEPLLRRMEKVASTFGRPVWITEFAVGDWKAKSVEQNKHSAGSIQAFMKQVIPALEEASFIERYAWFSATPDNKALGTSALFDAEGGLTRLGRIYRNA